MIHKEPLENNYLTIIKLILGGPGKTILSRYLSLQAGSLLNNQTNISFLTFYNFMGLPFEISTRLYNILLSLSNQKDALSKKDFVYGLGLFYSNSFIDDKLTNENRIFATDYLGAYFKKDIKDIINFRDMVLNNQDIKRNERIKRLENSITNLYGKCGQEVHKTIKKEVFLLLITIFLQYPIIYNI